MSRNLSIAVKQYIYHLYFLLQDLPAAIMQQLTSDPAMLRSVLEYHIVEGEATCSDLYNGRALDTLNSKGKIAVNEYSNVSFHMDFIFCV